VTDGAHGAEGDEGAAEVADERLLVALGAGYAGRRGAPAEQRT
jgi:hypothetical protein